MSGTSQRMRKSSPCSTSKQGPMRATLPVSSLLRHSRQGSTLRKSNNNSPTVSPTNVNAWRARISPETSSSGQRSPGSLSYKGNCSIKFFQLYFTLKLFPEVAKPTRKTKSGTARDWWQVCTPPSLSTPFFTFHCQDIFILS